MTNIIICYNVSIRNGEYMKIGSRIRENRKNSKMTQEMLCEKLGNKYSQVTISKIENNERTINVEEVKIFANALGVEVLDLIKD